jgi:hypothetical protein
MAILGPGLELCTRMLVDEAGPCNRGEHLLCQWPATSRAIIERRYYSSRFTIPRRYSPVYPSADRRGREFAIAGDRAIELKVTVLVDSTKADQPEFSSTGNLGPAGSEPTPQAALAAGFQINALACDTYLSRDKHIFPRVVLVPH